MKIKLFDKVYDLLYGLLVLRLAVAGLDVVESSRLQGGKMHCNGCLHGRVHSFQVCRNLRHT